MYIFCIIMICVASILLILAVLVQSPKSGMAANFGAANQTMGVRQTTDFLEKFTWAMVAAVVFFSLLATTSNPKVVAAGHNETNDAAINAAKGAIEPADDAAEFVGEGSVVVDGEGADQTIKLQPVEDVIPMDVESAAAIETTPAVEPEVSAEVQNVVDEVVATANEEVAVANEEVSTAVNEEAQIEE